MVQTVYIIHGANANPNVNWFPWLKKELEKLGADVIIPSFPIKKKQKLDNWLDTFNGPLQYLDENSIMIGHSLGPAFIMNVLERTQTTIKACFFVAPFTENLEIPKYDKINETFYKESFKWNIIKRRCKKFYVYVSDNDPAVPLRMSKFVSDKLDAKFEIIHNGGHLNSESGYTKFTLLLADLKKEIS